MKSHYKLDALNCINFRESVTLFLRHVFAFVEITCTLSGSDDLGCALGVVEFICPFQGLIISVVFRNERNRSNLIMYR